MNIEPLIANLGHPDETERIYAAEDIGFADDAEGIAPLLRRLHVEPSRAVKGAIFQALNRMTDPGVIPAVVELLGSEDAFVRNEAVELLKQRGESALPALTAAFGDANKDVRKFALDALSGLAAPQVDALYSQALRDTDLNVIITAVEYIGLQRRGTLRGEVEKIFLQAADAMLITSCLEAFGQIGDSACLPAVRAKFPDMKRLPKFHGATLVRMLGAVGGPDEYAILVGQLRPDGKQATDQALAALVSIHNRHPNAFVSAEALPPLCSLIDDSDSPLLKYQALVLAGCLPPSHQAFRILSSRLHSLERLERLGAIEGLSHSRYSEIRTYLGGRLELEKDEEVRTALRCEMERKDA